MTKTKQKGKFVILYNVDKDGEADDFHLLDDKFYASEQAAIEEIRTETEKDIINNEHYTYLVAKLICEVTQKLPLPPKVDLEIKKL